MLAAIGGAVWLADADAGLRLQHQINLESLQASPDQPMGHFHRQLLEVVLRTGEGRLLPPRSADSGQPGCKNPTDFLLIIHPLLVDRDVVGLIEVIQRPTTNAAALRGNRRLVTIVSEHASDCLKRYRIRELRQSLLQSKQFEHFAHQVHRSLDLRSTAYELVNEGRRYIGCDRVSVAVRHWRKYRLLAVSGVDTLNRRSNLVHRLEKLVSAVSRMGESLWYDGDNSELPPQIEEHIDSYVDDAHARTIAIVPLPVTTVVENPTASLPLGMLIVEKFDGVSDESWRSRVASVADQGGLALKNAVDFRNLPTLPFARARSNAAFGRQRKPLGVCAAVLMGLACAAVIALTSADFHVGVRGELQPRQRRDVFAPLDGQIVDLHVGHNDAVAAGDILLVLDSTEIDLEVQRVTGERDTAQKRMSAIELALLQFNPGDDNGAFGRERLAAEQEELKLLLASHQRRLDLLRAQRAELQVRSPIDGRVLTWDAHQLLADRPVQRGQVLMTVANLEGPWVAELQIPDDRIGFVLNVQADKGTLPRVTFELATDRGVVHEGVIRHIANRAEPTQDERHTVRATVDIDAEMIAELRPGATILAKIHCGQKRLGYIWLHGLIDALREWLLL